MSDEAVVGKEIDKDKEKIYPSHTELRIYPSFTEIREKFNAPKVKLIENFDEFSFDHSLLPEF